MRALCVVRLVVALLAAAGASAVSAQGITSVKGIDGLPQGSIGTEVTIKSSISLGSQKPRVMLIDPRTGKSYGLKVLAHTKGSIVARIRKAVAGELQLVVDPHGKATEPMFAPVSFTVLPPELTPETWYPVPPFLAIGRPGSYVTLPGAFLGTGKPHVRIGGQKAKVAYCSGKQMSVRVPKGLAPGAQLVEFENAIGATVGELLVLPAAAATHVSVQLVVDAVPFELEVTRASVGTTTSLLTGVQRTWVELDADSADGWHDLTCWLYMDAALAAPLVFPAPYEETAEPQLRCHFGGSGPGPFPSDTPGNIPGGIIYQPTAPFTLSVAQLDPVQHTVQVQFGGSMISTWPVTVTVEAGGSLSIAP